MSGRRRRSSTAVKEKEVPATGAGGPAKRAAVGRGKRHNPLATVTTETKEKPQDGANFGISTNSKKELLENFRCSICLDMFFEPVSLSCGHNFCKLCSLGRLLRNCPLCKSDVASVVSLKVNSTLKALVQQFFPEEYTIREQRWQKENELWTADVVAALQGAKMFTEPELYEAFRVQFEKRQTGADLPTRQQFIYFLAHMRRNGTIAVLKGKPFLFMDPSAATGNGGDVSNLLAELKRRKDTLPSFSVAKKKWQHNWCTVLLQKLKSIDEQLYLKAKEAMDVFFDEFETLEDFSETTPALDSGSSSSSTPSYLSTPFPLPFRSMPMSAYDSSDSDSDLDSDEDDYYCSHCHTIHR